MASVNATRFVSLNDVLLSNTWDLNKTVSFMHHWVGTSFYITAAYLTTVYHIFNIFLKYFLFI